MDLRVVKTLETIRATFEDMVCEMDYAKITVTGLDGHRSNILQNFLGETPLMVYRLWVEGGKRIPLAEAGDQE